MRIYQSAVCLADGIAQALIKAESRCVELQRLVTQMEADAEAQRQEVAQLREASRGAGRRDRQSEAAHRAEVRCAALQERAERSEAQRSAQAEELSKLREEHAQLQRACASTAGAQAEELSKAESRGRALQARLQRADASVTAGVEALREAERQCSQLKERLASSEADVRAATEELQRERAKAIAGGASSPEGGDAARDRAAEELRRAQALCQTLRQWAERTEAEATGKAEELRREKAASLQLRQRVEALEAAAGDSSKELTVLRSQSRELQSQLARRGAEAAARTEELERAKTQCKELSERVVRAEADAAASQEELQAARGLCQDLREQVSRQEADCRAAALERRQAEARCRQLCSEVSQKEMQATVARQDVHREQSRCQELEERLEAMRTDLLAQTASAAAKERELGRRAGPRGRPGGGSPGGAGAGEPAGLAAQCQERPAWEAAAAGIRSCEPGAEFYAGALQNASYDWFQAASVAINEICLMLQDLERECHVRSLALMSLLSLGLLLCTQPYEVAETGEDYPLNAAKDPQRALIALQKTRGNFADLQILAESTEHHDKAFHSACDENRETAGGVGFWVLYDRQEPRLPGQNALVAIPARPADAAVTGRHHYQLTFWKRVFASVAQAEGPPAKRGAIAFASGSKHRAFQRALFLGTVDSSDFDPLSKQRIATLGARRARDALVKTRTAEQHDIDPRVCQGARTVTLRGMAAVTEMQQFLADVYPLLALRALLRAAPSSTAHMDILSLKRWAGFEMLLGIEATLSSAMGAKLSIARLFGAIVSDRLSPTRKLDDARYDGEIRSRAQSRGRARGRGRASKAKSPQQAYLLDLQNNLDYDAFDQTISKRLIHARDPFTGVEGAKPVNLSLECTEAWVMQWIPSVFMNPSIGDYND
ncbi:unnamed protein product [Prorocentrum cordatum]|uniref:Uncharacterized protein n=1 Tax=Prorocentrum cordatum TaxID=2364126 RepID=A0ABN9WDB7_9DINO|nr:unnamed protein product [Polarella glacialis]